MSYGLEIYRSDGSLWVSPEVTPLNYMGKIRFGVGNSTVTTNVPITKSMTYFVRHDKEHGLGIFTMVKGSTNYNIKITNARYAGYIYVFANHVLNEHGYGIAVYNQSGQMTWNSEMRPLQIIPVNNPYGVDQRGDITISVDFNAAISPGVVSTWLAPLNPAAGIFLIGSLLAGAAGKKLCISRFDGEQIQGQRPPYRYKPQLLCINTDLYP